MLSGLVGDVIAIVVFVVVVVLLVLGQIPALEGGLIGALALAHLT
jgi:hypothetical protein